MRVVSEDGKRALTDSLIFGAAAAYEGEWHGKEWRGRHVGVFGMIEDAERWLETGEPKPRPIYPPKSPEQVA